MGWGPGGVMRGQEKAVRLTLGLWRRQEGLRRLRDRPGLQGVKLGRSGAGLK